MGWATLCAGGVGSGVVGVVYRVWGCAAGGAELVWALAQYQSVESVFRGSPKTRRDINVLRFPRFTKRTKTGSMACDF
jgi:hypothetical protein